MPRPPNPIDTSVPFAARAALTIRDFCIAYGVCRATFYNLCSAGKIHPVKAGGRTLIVRSDADAWLASLPPATIAQKAA